MLVQFLMIGFATFFLTEAIRKLPVIETWALSGKRPWGCNLCMSFWVGLLTAGVSAWWHQDVWGLACWFPGSGLGYYLLQQTDHWAEATPPPPEMDLSRTGSEV